MNGKDGGRNFREREEGMEKMRQRIKGEDRGRRVIRYSRHKWLGGAASS